MPTPIRPRRLAPVFSALLLPLPSPAQDPLRFETVLDASIAAPADHELVRDLQRKAAEMFAAGEKDHGHANFANRVFFCPATVAGLPLRLRLYRRPGDDNLKNPLLHVDTEKAVDWGEVFSSIGAEKMGGLDDAWIVQRMYLHSVPRPQGGFRLNFGREFGADPAKDPLFKTFTDFDARPFHPAIAARLRPAPIHLMIDLSGPLSDWEEKELTRLLGPRAAVFGAGVSRLGRQLVVDLFNGCRPGDGLVGAYLAPRAGAATVLGALHQTPGALLCADLGTHFSRMAVTAVRALPRRGDGAATQSLDDLLSAWTGEVCVAFDGLDPAPDGESDAQMQRLAQSLQGTITLRLEEGVAGGIEASLETALRGPLSALLDLDAEAVGDGERLAFSILGGRKHLALGSAGRLLVISVADEPERCLRNLDKTLQPRNKVPLPGKFGMAQGPVKLWLRAGLARYAHAWGRHAGAFIGRKSPHLTAWILETLHKDLLAEDVALTLSWHERTGASLRAIF